MSACLFKIGRERGVRLGQGGESVGLHFDIVRTLHVGGGLGGGGDIPALSASRNRLADVPLCSFVSIVLPTTGAVWTEVERVECKFRTCMDHEKVFPTATQTV